MKCFPDNFSRQQTLWLLFNGLFAALLALHLVDLAVWNIRNTGHFVDPGILAAFVGSIAAMIAGTLITLLCAWHLRKPLALRPMRFHLTSVAIVEASVVFVWGSMNYALALVSVFLMVAITANFVLIIIQHRLPEKSAKQAEQPSGETERRTI